MMPVYRGFGLTDSEIAVIAGSVMKRDYFYTSPLGRRKFQLDLGPLTLAMIGAPNHKLLDSLAEQYGVGVPLCKQIFDAQHIGYEHYITGNAPDDSCVVHISQSDTQSSGRHNAAQPPLEIQADAKDNVTKAALILDAAAALPERKSKSGHGRAALLAAETLGVSAATLYQARRLLKSGDQTLIDRVRSGGLSVKKACALLKRDAVDTEMPEEMEQAAS